MGVDPTEVVRSFWESVWSEGNADVLSDIFDPHIRENGEPVDVGSFQQAVTSWRRTFPDFTATVEELIAVGEDRVVSRVTYRGTQHLPFWGLPATGRSFECIGIDIFRVQHGRIVELWHVTDHYVMATQLGGRLVPEEPAGDV